MRKLYKKLTEDQKKRGVIFSSTISRCTTELESDTIHEVFEDDVDAGRQIHNLLDDSFFDGNPCGWKYNIVRR